MSRLKINQSGFSIVEILVSLGLIGIAMGAMISMISYQNTAIKQMESKLAILDLERYMITTLSGSSVCSFALTNPTPKKFNSEDALSSISLSKIPSSANVSAPNIISVGGNISPTVTVQSISVKDIQTSGNTDEFRGYLEVAFLNSAGMQFKPLRFLINIKTDPSSASTEKEVVSCNTPSTNSSGGGIQVFTSSGFFVVPKGVTNVSVIVQGAGGGGGPYRGSGGGGGGVAVGAVSVTPGTQIPVQVGNGGSGGCFKILGCNVDSTDGGTTSFSGISCSGGKRGRLNFALGGSGGTCVGGTSTTPGEAGKSDGAGGAGQGLGGGAGGAENNGPCRNGLNGNLFGGGGSGAGYESGCPDSFSGGSGAPGRVIIEW